MKDRKPLTVNEEDKTVNSTKNKRKNRLVSHASLHLRGLHRQHKSTSNLLKKSSSIPSQSGLHKLIVQSQSFNDGNLSETTKFSLPTSPIPANRVLYLSTEEINYYKKRQSELDYTVKVLIEHLKLKANNNINQIFKCWSYLKQLSLDQIQRKAKLHQFIDYMLKINSVKKIDLYLEQNDEINAALQILSTILNVVHNKFTLTQIKQLFDQEEKTTIESLRYDLELLLSSYFDELSFIHECSHFYQTNLDAEKSFHWIKIIKVEYPLLIEKISNDFIMNLPEVEHILKNMLRNMKKRLLNIDVENTNKN